MNEPFGLTALDKLKMLHREASGYAYIGGKRDPDHTDLWKACEDVKEWLAALEQK